MPWYVFASIILLPLTVLHFLLNVPRERWKKEFFRKAVWLIPLGYVLLWAFEPYVLPHLP